MSQGKVNICRFVALILTISLAVFYFLIDALKPVVWTNSTNRTVVIKEETPFMMTVNCTEKGYLTIYSQGRLGNLLFEYFSLVGIASSNGMVPLLEENMAKKLAKLFNISNIDIIDPKRDYNWNKFTETAALKYDTNVEYLNKTRNWQLKGYFQSWRYFLNTKWFGRDLHTVQFNDNLMKNAADYFLNVSCPMNDSSCVKVAIHIRRGDTITDKIRVLGYLEVPATYYHKAMDYFRNKFNPKKVIFIIGSDDMDWCRENFNDSNVHLSNMKSAEEDMVMLGRCDHAIIGQGSYGRMIGHFTGGEVIYNKAWPRPDTFLSRQTNISDVFPNTWIAME